MIIGIGCNIMTAPTVVSTGTDNGRPATCLARHMNCNSADSADREIREISVGGEGPDGSEGFRGQSEACHSIGILHKEIAAEIYGALSSHILQSSDPPERVVADFERYMNFSPQKLRGESEVGDAVTPLRINKDGTLQVSSDTDLMLLYLISFDFM